MSKQQKANIKLQVTVEMKSDAEFVSRITAPTLEGYVAGITARSVKRFFESVSDDFGQIDKVSKMSQSADVTVEMVEVKNAISE